MSQRVEKIVVARSHENYKACHRLCSLSRRLGNCASYHLRHLVFDKKQTPTRKELDNELKSRYAKDYRAMPSAASAQRIIQVVAEQFRSFRKASKEYRAHPEKFTGKPKLPGYQDKYRTFYVNRNGYCIKDGKLILTGGEKVGFKPLTVRSCQNQSLNAPVAETVVGDVRIVAKGMSFVIELTYEKEDVKKKDLDPEAACVIDPGVENFATVISTRPGLTPILVKGTVLKSINQRYNANVSSLREHNKHKKHIAIRSAHRNRQVDDMLHKMSRFVIEYCLANRLGRIIIGRNPFWKQGVNLGKVNNQNFVCLPHARFFEMVSYKAEEQGIEVEFTDEAYTSKASALDFDMIPSYEKAKTCKFSGKRIHRGLYRSKSGKLINADVNGALNIARKVLGDDWLRSQSEPIGAYLDTPIAIRSLNNQSCASLLEAGLRSCESSHVSAR